MVPSSVMNWWSSCYNSFPSFLIWQYEFIIYDSLNESIKQWYDYHLALGLVLLFRLRLKKSLKRGKSGWLNNKKRRKITLWNSRGSTWNKYVTAIGSHEVFNSIIHNLDVTYWCGHNLSEQSFETRLWEELSWDTCATWKRDRGACWNQNHAHSSRCGSFQCKH